MNEAEKLAMDELKRRVEQHEKTIVQLLEIIAATNCRIAELSSNRSISS
ncbi:hypothetical protein GMD78_17595 [Ornithinibacillus sp. L9]|uniref:Uncharacterized protein n=1 Tax=Ornithinibacillus caprae TaxID=2678566 RepID=A0A6N8FQB7_9BACI|nr:hypothetical protein [Ornithinibacillus caprae]MUK90189.1 hypothetical protein [Ornithinibacillus caprae]